LVPRATTVLAPIIGEHDRRLPQPAYRELPESIAARIEAGEWLPPPRAGRAPDWRAAYV
jgi:hypothetical protein